MSRVRKIVRVHGRAMPLRGRDIDTDRIIPARYMKATRFDTLGEFAFYDVRFDKEGRPLKHPLNDKRFQGARILVVESNFGSGSSREHAPQALMRYGFEAFIGESFAEIFQGNCLAMGLPVITLPAADIKHMLQCVEDDPGMELDIDLLERRLTADRTYDIRMNEGARMALVNGSWDSTSSLMVNIEGIRATAARLPYLDGFKDHNGVQSK